MIQLSKSYRSLSFAVLSLVLAVPMIATSALADAPAVDLSATTPTASAADSPSTRHAGTRVNVSGEVARYVVGPLGHVRAFVLKDGTAVMVHEAGGDAMAKAVPVGQTVRVEGFSPASSAGKAVMHAAVYGLHGQVVTPPARGEHGADKTDREERRAELNKLPEASANGTVESVIAGHRGRPTALVLSDGTSVFLHHSLAKALMTRGVKVGDQIKSTGKGATYPLGASVYAASITFADGAHFEAKTQTDKPAS